MYVNTIEHSSVLYSGIEEHILEGGCHAGFGSYGPQDGDGVPTTTGEEQIAEIVRLLTVFWIAQRNDPFSRPSRNLPWRFFFILAKIDLDFHEFQSDQYHTKRKRRITS